VSWQRREQGACQQAALTLCCQRVASHHGAEAAGQEEWHVRDGDLVQWRQGRRQQAAKWGAEDNSLEAGFCDRVSRRRGGQHHWVGVWGQVSVPRSESRLYDAQKALWRHTRTVARLQAQVAPHVRVQRFRGWCVIRVAYAGHCAAWEFKEFRISGVRRGVSAVSEVNARSRRTVDLVGS
jgi:hypothetical protein